MHSVALASNCEEINGTIGSDTGLAFGIEKNVLHNTPMSLGLGLSLGIDMKSTMRSGTWLDTSILVPSCTRLAAGRRLPQSI
jgi:hypothetical protein